MDAGTILVKVIIAGLAVWQIVEVTHHSKIALPARRWATGVLREGTPVRLYQPWLCFRLFLANIINCAFCQAHWWGGAIMLLLMFTEVSAWFWFVPCIFAATRLAGLGNDLSYDACRTPEYDVDVEEDIIEVADGETDQRLE